MEKLVEDYTVEELRSLMQECNGYDGSFEWLYCYDSYVIEDILHGTDILNIMNMVHFGNYNPFHEWFRFDGYGNIETLSDYGYEEEIKDNAQEIIEHAKKLGFID